MKELTIEEKAKVYTELINRLEDVKDAIKKQNYGIAMDILCKPYPDFQVTTHSEPKDEDERIRKELLNAFQESEDSLYMVLTPHRRESFIAWLEKQGNLMKALQISNAEIGELIEKNYYLKEQLEKQGKNNMGILEATKKKLEDNLNKALEKETPESCNEFLDKQGEQKTTIKMKTPEESLGIDSDTYNKIVDECIYGEQKPIKEHNACEFCEDRYGCVNPCSMKLIEKEKPVSKGEPKFKVGDFIVNDYCIGKVIELTNDTYLLDTGQGIPFSCEHNAHLWTIQDAKAGDVLAVTMYPEGTWIGILKEYNGCTFSSYCFVNTEGTFKLGTYNHGNGKAIHPATKEQRNLLFQKMKEAGYEWSDKDRKLIKIVK